MIDNILKYSPLVQRQARVTRFSTKIRVCSHRNFVCYVQTLGYFFEDGIRIQIDLLFIIPMIYGSKGTLIKLPHQWRALYYPTRSMIVRATIFVEAIRSSIQSSSL